MLVLDHQTHWCRGYFPFLAESCVILSKLINFLLHVLYWKVVFLVTAQLRRGFPSCLVLVVLFHITAAFQSLKTNLLSRRLLKLHAEVHLMWWYFQKTSLRPTKSGWWSQNVSCNYPCITSVCNSIGGKTSTEGGTDQGFVLQEFQIRSLRFCGLHPSNILDDGAYSWRGTTVWTLKTGPKRKLSWFWLQ